MKKKASPPANAGGATHSTAPRVPEAQTVVVLLHGVGDHKSVDLRQAAIAGIKDASIAAGIECPITQRVIGLRGNVTMPCPAALVQMGDVNHLVVPLVWSNWRTRWASNQMDDGIGRELADREGWPKPIYVLEFLGLARRAPGALRKFLVSGTGVFLLCVYALMYGLCALAAYVVVSGSELHRLRFPIVVFLVIVLSSRLQRYRDLIVDVAVYVCRGEARAELEARFQSTVRQLAQEAGARRIVIVAHSLGSLLAMKAIPMLGDESRIVLVTLGSPARTLSWMFPTIFTSPAVFAQWCDRSAIVESWINAWRDGDLIGRSLGLGNQARTVELRLGAGGHSGYWSDTRLWRMLGGIILAGRAAVPAEDEDAVMRELASWRIRRAMRHLGVTTMCITALLLRLEFYPHAFSSESWLSLSRLASRVVIAGSVVFGVMQTGVLLKPGQSPRDRIALFRLIGPLESGLFYSIFGSYAFALVSTFELYSLARRLA